MTPAGRESGDPRDAKRAYPGRPDGVDWTTAAGTHDCPACWRAWIAAGARGRPLLPQRTLAALAAGVLALSATAPATVPAAEPPDPQDGGSSLNQAELGNPDLNLEGPDMLAHETPDPGEPDDPEPVGGEAGSSTGDVADQPVADEAPVSTETGEQTMEADARDSTEVDDDPAPVGDNPAPVEGEDPAGVAEGDPTATDGAAAPTAPSGTPGQTATAPAADTGVPMRPMRTSPVRKRLVLTGKSRAKAPYRASAPPASASQPRAVQRPPAESAVVVGVPRTTKPAGGAAMSPASIGRETLSAARSRAVSLSATPVGHRARSGDRSHVVRPGESLWSIATDLLGDGASSARVAREVSRLWDLNRGRIGTSDPDLLIVGTRLALR